MAYSLTNVLPKIIGTGQQFLKLSVVVWWYRFLRHRVESKAVTTTLIF